MSDQKALRQELGRLGQLEDHHIPMVRTALLFAALDYSVASLEPYLHDVRQMERIVEDQTAGLDPPSLAVCIDALRAAFLEYGQFSGDVDTYDDQSNANLIQVLDRRKGLPVALGLICIHLGDRFGQAVAGLAFPGHFLIRVESAGQRAILDPFHGLQHMAPAQLRTLIKAMKGDGAELSPTDYRPVNRKDVILRLQNNIKLRRLEAGDVQGALSIVKDLLIFTPNDPYLWRERGMINLRLGALQDAVSCLDQYLSVVPPCPDRSRIDQVVKRLRAKLN